jgi:hypothetical protein
MRAFGHILAVLCAVVLPLLASAGDWQPDPARRYTFKLNGGKPEQIQDQDRHWAQSLAANLQRRGGTVVAFKIFPRLNRAQLLVNAASTAYYAYQADGQARYLALDLDGHGVPFLLDFGHEAVFLAAGPSLHPHPTRRFVVAIYPRREGLSGIPVDGPGVGLQFSDEMASWQ